jgi:hypothetical protein
MKAQTICLLLLLLSALDARIIENLAVREAPKVEEVTSATFLDALETEDFAALAAKAEKTDIRAVIEDARKKSAGKLGTAQTDASTERRIIRLPE